MGKSDHLRRHDNIIGCFSDIDHADIFSTVMQDRSQAQIQTLSLAHAVDLFHTVKNRGGDMFQGVCSPATAIVAFADIHCAGNNILRKIMLSPE